ncbi:MAG: ABC transporter permease [Lachnospiraceae bacterium]|jgi:ribose/xylose/arabinose/galactoside ABC-type transport system permease subunit|nr:ABC transporter permease [Lachnospiraceae bacterium]
MKKKKGILTIFQPEYALFWLILLAIIFFWIMQPAFVSFGNLMNVLKNASYMALMVLGLTWVIATNEMDCSFPDVAACASMVFAWLAFHGYSVLVSFIIAMLSGILCGVLTSILVVRFKYHSLITTIAVSTIAKSVAAALYGGMPLSVPVIKSTGFYKFVNSYLAGIPVIFIIAVAIYAVLFIIQEKTRYGQYVYALGENRVAVQEAGIKTGKVLTGVFITSAFFAALSGILMVFVVYGSGQPKMGSAFFLDGFTVVFLGAMVMKLGKTNVVGTFLGGIMLAIVVNGLTQLGASFATSQITKGVLLVIGIVIAALGQRKNRGKAGLLKYE